MPAQPAFDEFEEARDGLTGRSCSLALMHLRRLMEARPGSVALEEAGMLAETSMRIRTCLDAAHDALSLGDQDSAALEWARAQVLLIEFNRRQTLEVSAPHQKSGTAR